MTPADASRAVLAIENEVPYLALCINEKHREFLEKSIIVLIFREFGCPTSKLFREVYTKDIKPFEKEAKSDSALKAKISTFQKTQDFCTPSFRFIVGAARSC